MKKVALLVVFCTLFSIPVYAGGACCDGKHEGKACPVATTHGTNVTPGNISSGQDVVKNVSTGYRNTATGWVEIMDGMGEEAAKGRNPGEHVTGVVAGGAIGARRTIHRLGAGIIDLATFWIPKNKPLIDPEKARLE